RTRRAFIGLVVAVVVVAVTGLGRGRRTDALHRSVDALLLAVAHRADAARAHAVDRVGAGPVLGELAVAVVVDVVARGVVRRRRAVARDDAVDADGGTDAAVRRAVGRRE